MKEIWKNVKIWNWKIIKIYTTDAWLQSHYLGKKKPIGTVKTVNCERIHAVPEKIINESWTPLHKEDLCSEKSCCTLYVKSTESKSLAKWEVLGCEMLCWMRIQWRYQDKYIENLSGHCVAVNKIRFTVCSVSLLPMWSLRRKPGAASGGEDRQQQEIERKKGSCPSKKEIWPWERRKENKESCYCL